MAAKNTRKKSSVRPAKKKAGSVKNTRKSASKKRQPKKREVLSSRLVQVCLIVLLSALSLLTILKLGAAGAFLYGCVSLIMGTFAYVFLIGFLMYSFWYIWTGGKNRLESRFWIGSVLMACGWSMMAAMPAITSQDPYGLLLQTASSASGILNGSASTYCGLLGAGLAGWFTSLFDPTGSWIMAGTLLILSAVLVGWSMLKEAMVMMKDSSEQAVKAMNARRQETRLQRKEERARLLEAEAMMKDQEPENLTLFSSEEASRPFSLDQTADLLAEVGRGKSGIRKKRTEKRKKNSVFSFLQSETADSFGKKTAGSLKKQKDIPAEELIAQVPISGASIDFDLMAEQEQNAPKQNTQAVSDQTDRKTGKHLEEKKKTDSSTAEKSSVKTGTLRQTSASKTSGSAASYQPIDKLASLSESDLPEGQKSPDELIRKSQSGSGSLAQNKKAGPEQIAEDEAKMTEMFPAAVYDNYRLPKISLLNESPKNSRSQVNTQQARENGAKLINILKQFNVPAQLTEIHIGPSVTKFEISPGVGVRVNTITNLQNDIKMALAATDIRIEAPIPGKSAVGIEVPNPEKTEVSMRDLMKNIPEKLSRLPLVFALGKDLLGDNVYGRLDTMPHLLIAGATGSGKSVCVNSIISSILMRTRPDEVKMILVDPKKVEFTPYNDVPHLLAPVITDGDLANKALKVVVEMMDARYDLFEEARVRNINSFNAFVDQNPGTHLKRLPRIVVIIDELADLMLVAAKEVEQSIQRITQLARAAGIHLIVATQRPSVNVITGVIKANIPSRIAFAVSSTVDSRTILDQSGAERLLGYGDMLFLDNGETTPRRIQGVFIKDEEVNAIASYVKSQGVPQYDDAFITLKDLQTQGGTVAAEADDPLYDQIKHFVIQSRKASTSLIQRRFSIGYARAARLMDSLELNGIIGPANGSKPREILVQMNYDDE